VSRGQGSGAETRFLGCYSGTGVQRVHARVCSARSIGSAHCKNGSFTWCVNAQPWISGVESTDLVLPGCANLTGLITEDDSCSSMVLNSYVIFLAHMGSWICVRKPFVAARLCQRRQISRALNGRAGPRISEFDSHCVRSHESWSALQRATRGDARRYPLFMR